MKRIVSIVLFGALFAPFALAQSDTVRPKTKQDELREAEVLDAQEALASFGYGTVFTGKLDDKTTEALRSYQTRSGLPVTGDVDAVTMQRLVKDKAELERHIPLGPLYMFLDADWKNFVEVRGVWLEQGKQPDAETPVLPATVECFKSVGQCILAGLSVEGSETIRLWFFDIERWDEYEIVTKPDDLPCGRETIHINRPGKTLLKINTAAYKNAKACTEMFGPPSAESVVRLDDGTKITDARMDALKAASKRIRLISAEAQSRDEPPTGKTAPFVELR